MYSTFCGIFWFVEMKRWIGELISGAVTELKRGIATLHHIIKASISNRRQPTTSSMRSCLFCRHGPVRSAEQCVTAACVGGKRGAARPAFWSGWPATMATTTSTSIWRGTHTASRWYILARLRPCTRRGVCRGNLRCAAFNAEEVRMPSKLKFCFVLFPWQNSEGGPVKSTETPPHTDDTLHSTVELFDVDFFF